MFFTLLWEKSTFLENLSNSLHNYSALCIICKTLLCLVQYNTIRRTWNINIWVERYVYTGCYYFPLPMKGMRRQPGSKESSGFNYKDEINSFNLCIYSPSSSSSLQCQKVFTLRNSAACTLCICHCLLVVRCWKSIPVILDLHVSWKKSLKVKTDLVWMNMP